MDVMGHGSGPNQLCTLRLSFLCTSQVHERTQSADGYDINFATNVLGGWVLTLLLEQALKAGAPGSRVIFVSSGGMLTGRLGQGSSFSVDDEDGWEGELACLRLLIFSGAMPGAAAMAMRPIIQQGQGQVYLSATHAPCAHREAGGG